MLVVPADQSEDSPLSASHSSAPSPANRNTEKNGGNLAEIQGLNPPKREMEQRRAVFKEKTGEIQSFAEKKKVIYFYKTVRFSKSIKQNDLKVLRTPTISEK